MSEGERGRERKRERERDVTLKGRRGRKFPNQAKKKSLALR